MSDPVNKEKTKTAKQDKSVEISDEQLEDVAGGVARPDGSQGQIAGNPNRGFGDTDSYEVDHPIFSVDEAKALAE